MAEYNNRVGAELLLSGFKYGFRLQYTGPRISVWSTNHVNVETHKVETQIKLDKEIIMGRVLGPFSEKPISTLRISPIVLVEKLDNGWRLIKHLSYPNQFSVNHFIDKDLCAVKYTSFDGVIDMTSELGKSGKIAKLDISEAFRLLIVNPVDFNLLVIMFEGKFDIDKFLPMGCAISCSLFQQFSTCLYWLYRPLSKHTFSALLNKSLAGLGLAEAHFKSHSFRIGIATILAMEGMPDENIKFLGRWKSNSS